ncbi:uncharacterized protein LOC112270311 [Brachypodium distachyon]|uniref:uncharacterized protein LOC112270311 n=1 Tax=Brachypodium distachyon TaxID=15368 RepID=UPI00052FEB57|nr:uncharacterized protein LOC112270311 [Brachypodium distachyon]|eukprot:XP_024313917.1 uncharacterized protein LOC112270311 [Brachypodium distachyon]
MMNQLGSRRRFLNLLVRSSRDGLYSLRRMDPYKNLFYDSTKQAEEAAAAACADGKRKKKFDKTIRRLPDPVTRFGSSTIGALPDGLEWFELLSPRVSTDGRIVNSTKAGELAMFDADNSIFYTLPPLHQPKGFEPVAFSVTPPGGDDDKQQHLLYLLDRYPGRLATRPRMSPSCNHPRSCFEVVELGFKDSRSKGGWRSRLLPPPPYVHQPGYQPSLINSYTTMENTADGSTSICVSSQGFGTYCFDTACRDDTHQLGWRPLEEWRHVGDWTLPFDGRGEHIRELDIWLGFKWDTPPCRLNHLCAVDLSAAMDQGRPPAIQHVWGGLSGMSDQEEQQLLPMHRRVVNLGGGKLCIAKVLDDIEGKRFAVLTGIELLRDPNKSLRIVKHKCARYTSVMEMIRWVL